TGAPASLAVEVHERAEAMRLSADDRDHEREPEQPRAHERLRRAAHADPDWQALLERSRVHALARERRPMLAGPLRMLLVAQREQKVELLGEQRVVVVKVEAEKRERVDE